MIGKTLLNALGLQGVWAMCDLVVGSERGIEDFLTGLTRLTGLMGGRKRRVHLVNDIGPVESREPILTQRRGGRGEHF